MERRKGDFTAIGEILEQRVIGGKTPPVLSLLALVQKWPGIVGGRIAEQAAPVRLRNGMLTLQVHSPTWAHELQMMAPQLLSAIHQGCPQLKIEKLRFVS